MMCYIERELKNRMMFDMKRMMMMMMILLVLLMTIRRTDALMRMKRVFVMRRRLV